MNNENQLISSDNKGFASYMWETEESLLGNPNFTAAFLQSNSGDISPNTSPARCTDTGKLCDGSFGSCAGDVTKCVARGPGYEDGGDFQATKIAGNKQFLKAKQMANEVTDALVTGGLDYRHRLVNMSDICVEDKKGQSKRTCKPAVGMSAVAGTTDGPGSGLAFQGANSTSGISSILKFAGQLFKKPSQAQIDCHSPKQIFISTGEISIPYMWQPQVAPLQIFIISREFAIIGFPAELTTSESFSLY